MAWAEDARRQTTGPFADLPSAVAGQPVYVPDAAHQSTPACGLVDAHAMHAGHMAFPVGGDGQLASAGGGITRP
ncbi:hypothetical protein CSQ85_09325 [Bifidobacterium rousetti]|nr:hypothetical protein CSQ85_09325 [Bifidobacterium rousetti]